MSRARRKHLHLLILHCKVLFGNAVTAFTANGSHRCHRTLWVTVSKYCLSSPDLRLLTVITHCLPKEAPVGLHCSA